MPRSPLTETIRRVDGMITYVRENLSTDEYMLFLDLLAPEPEPAKKPQKKSSKKAAVKAGNTRQRRGLGQSLASIAQTVGGNNARQVLDGIGAATADDGNDSDSSLCIEAVDSKGETCGESADHNVHHLSTHPDYHEFKAYTPPARSAASTGSAG